MSEFETAGAYSEYPLLTLRQTVVFPHQTTTLNVNRPRSIASVEAAAATADKIMVVVAQRNEEQDVPGPDSMFTVGTRVVIRSLVRVRGMLHVEISGIDRVRIDQVWIEAGDVSRRDAKSKEGRPEERKPAGGSTDREAAFLYRARITPLELRTDPSGMMRFVGHDLVECARHLVETKSPRQLPAFDELLENRTSSMHLLYGICWMMKLSWRFEQKVLEAESEGAAMAVVREQLSKIWKQDQARESHKASRSSLPGAVKSGSEDGAMSVEQQDYQNLRDRLDSLSLPPEVYKEVRQGLKRLSRLSSGSGEYESTRAHLELVADLPWRRYTTDDIDLEKAERLLNRDHYGLQEVKERILEQLAVMKLKATARAPILCFVGPPGVGKTSLGKSIAETLGRKFARESLGGLTDEGELRGHRRTYIGAMPGRIVQAIQRAESMNPVLLLDEVDKLGRDFRGDPAAALLEILDPAQNHTFRDNYLTVPFDLSQVMFIATANTLDTIPRPLLDRMEVLEVSGYSDEEKLHIARRYLLPRQVIEMGLSAGQVSVTDAALRRMVNGYTRESGVRELTRTIATVCRKVATKVARGQRTLPQIDEPELEELLGQPRFPTQEMLRKQFGPGVVAGLARTVVGGEVLYIEAVLLPETKDLTLTGQLGEVMKESARTAQNCVRSKWAELDLEKQALACGVHIHVPAGATPKDGPSSGIAIATALTSLYSHQPARRDTAMTGEVTLTGLVLPVGGIKEKVLAAHRVGIKQIVLPRGNERDLEEVPESVRASLQFVLVDRVEEAIAAAIPAFARRLRYLLDEIDDD